MRDPPPPSAGVGSYLEDGAADVRGAAIARQLRHQLLQEVGDDGRGEELPALPQDLADAQDGGGAHGGMRVVQQRLLAFMNQLIYTLLPSPPTSMCHVCRHHDGVQLLLDGLVRGLVALVGVVHREGLREQQRGVSAHLKVGGLETPS